MLRDFLLQKGLSNREVEVAELVSKGLANKEVADQLFVTEKTVKFHLTNIYKKMSIKSRSQLIVWCLPHLRIQEEEEAKNESTNPGVTAGSVEMRIAGGSQNDLIAGNANQSTGTNTMNTSYDIGLGSLPGGIKTFK
tara:strand:- start:3239 stop:3649 length:411 start_codon:yes stop_codon:yes gene_type:complete